jgi:tRNA pseudouridine38-40 synthase
MQNIKLTIAYDGTDFFGWQKTCMGPSIEESLQKALEQILQEETALQAASRTDAGVHADGQVVNFLTAKPQLDLGKLTHSLNCLLPKSIAVLEALPAPPAFHPTLNCTGKEYHYQVCLGKAQLPRHRLYSWHCPFPLDLLLMQRAAKLFVGKHDFEGFCNQKNQTHYQDYVREVQRVELIQLPENRLRFEVEGNHFLYKMVRNIVGTLIYVGCGKLSIESIGEVLEGGNRTEAGVTAPAHGLSLFKVRY